MNLGIAFHPDLLKNKRMKKGIFILSFPLTGYHSFSSYSKYRGFGLGVFPTGGIALLYYDYNNFYFGNFGIPARYILR